MLEADSGRALGAEVDVPQQGQRGPGILVVLAHPERYRPVWENISVLEPLIDVFNLFNGSAIRARSTQLGPSYGVASDVVRGRIIKFGLNVKF